MNDVIINRLDDLRNELKKHDVDCIIIPTSDFHGSEYVGDYFKCRAFISGFTGSAGTVVVTQDEALLWTDGRYFLQAADELEGTTIKLQKMGQPGVLTIFEYLNSNLKDNACICFDGRCVDTNFVLELNKRTISKGFVIKSNLDLVGNIWKDRPSLSKEPAFELGLEYTGVSRSDKIKKVREHLQKGSAKTLILTSLDDIAWLLNIRGNDVACNPVVLSYCKVSLDDFILYINKDVLSNELLNSLSFDGITIKPYNDIYEDALKIDSKVLLDFSKVNYLLYSSIKDKVNERNYTTILKACKNEVEVKNAYLAHIKDGVAMVKFIYFLKHHPSLQDLSEVKSAKILENYRKMQPNFKGISFDTIAGYEHHGAIIHYDPTNESDIPLDHKSFLLVDSGGQYLEGTTDITRTISLGKLTPEEKMIYTAVLKGHLALSNAKFKEGYCGAQLDVLARLPLFELGLEYNHGTGHGVGMMLNVHEGPQSISPSLLRGAYPLKVGMITSNEPGMYLENKFGVRIENLTVVKEFKETEYGKFLCFDDLTVVPYDIEAINKQMLTSVEVYLIHQYHERVYETLKDYLTEDERVWLKGIVEAI